jgi:hypothetical protein
MALFADGAISDLDDLAAQDSQLLDVASTEGVNVTQKITLAQGELEIELASMLESLRLAAWPFSVILEPAIGNIVVTPALQLWHTYRTLEMVYADAYSDQLNDRYAAKRDQFHEFANWAREKLIQTGLGICTTPIPQAETPLLNATPGNLPDGTYYVTMAWINQIGQEGASGVPDAITTSSSTFEVQPATPPINANGWNVYVGQTSETMVMQNDEPIAAGQVWQQPAVLRTTGQAPGTGQPPNFLKAIPRVLQRG